MKRMTRRLSRFLVELERTRYHEAGHAVVAFLMGRRVTGITVFSEEDFAARGVGGTHYAPVHLTRRSRRPTIEASIRIALAGSIAESMLDSGFDGGDGGAADHWWLATLATWYRLRGIGLPEMLRDRRRLRAETRTLLRKEWRAVEAVACALSLTSGEVLDGREVHRIIREVRMVNGRRRRLSDNIARALVEARRRAFKTRARA